RAVRVLDVHSERRVCLSRRKQSDHAVGADPAAAIAEASRGIRADKCACASRVDQDEVVSEPVIFGERNRGHHRDWNGNVGVESKVEIRYDAPMSRVTALLLACVLAGPGCAPDDPSALPVILASSLVASPEIMFRDQFAVAAKTTATVQLADRSTGT